MPNWVRPYSPELFHWLNLIPALSPTAVLTTPISALLAPVLSPLTTNS